ncbi:ATP-dependent RNA helicase dbp6 [Oleoguttula sp. CCFEE 5521]
MTTLYKRYIPPKQGAATTIPPVVSSITAKRPVAPAAETKRKRERGDDEKAERKAKKLRKQLHDSGDGVLEQAAAVEAVEDISPVRVEENTTLKPDHSSEFGHIKNIKKRRKLEKEARAARKAAQKSTHDGDAELPVGGPGQDVDGGPELDRVAVGTDDATRVDTITPSSIANDNDRAVQHREMIIERLASPPTKELSVPAIVPTKRKAALDVSERGPGVASPAVTLDATPAPEKSRKRRHKLEAVVDQPKDVPEDLNVVDDHDEHLKKFGGVLNKFHSSQQKVQKRNEEEPETIEVDPVPEVQKRDLVPFPQPVNEVLPLVSAPSGLPDWLRAPISVSKDAEKTFEALDLPNEVVERLRLSGFSNAMPVQQALIPLLTPPGTQGAKYSKIAESIVPDIAVSAPTGSGKTIAYLLPIIEALKAGFASPETLRALIVVPTRELVAQVTAVAESLLKGSDLTVGIATGSSKLSDEQQRLIKTGSKYHPAHYKALMDRAQRRDYPPAEDSEEFDDFVNEMENWDDRLEREIQDALHGLPDHVPTYTSAVDILVCTPGRLLEHMSSTIGFSIVHSEWLVLDEADKLLDQQYDGFLERLNDELSRPRTKNEQGAREVYLRARGAWDDRFEQRVRKVVLSATMTRDIGKLSALKLKRPQMVVVQGAESDEPMDDVQGDGDHYELPSTLTEYCVPVGDGSDKPLHLVALLEWRLLGSRSKQRLERKGRTNGLSIGRSFDHENEVRLDSDSDASASSSTTSTISEDVDSDSSQSLHEGDEADDKADRPSAKSSSSDTTAPSPTILIFTSSTESAERLTYLLQKLRPDWAKWISSLTKTSGKASKESSSKFMPVITIATDRAGRGIDALQGRRISHVIQYDVPHSLTAYVHRVGRSARAGDSGEAWTLYTDPQARWYVNDIMRATNVKRLAPVERVRLDTGGEEAAARFADALDEMREMVSGKRAQTSTTLHSYDEACLQRFTGFMPRPMITSASTRSTRTPAFSSLLRYLLLSDITPDTAGNMAPSNNLFTADSNAPESLVADQLVIDWDWMNDLSTTTDVNMILDAISSPTEVAGDSLTLLSGAPGIGGPPGSQDQCTPDIQGLLKTNAKSQAAGASETVTTTNTAMKSKEQGSPVDEAELVILKSSKKRGIAAPKINEASTRRSKKLKIAQADANTKACPGICTIAKTSPETQRAQLICCIQKANATLKAGEFVSWNEYKALSGNETFVDIFNLQRELANWAVEAPPGARSVLKKSARDFLDDEPDVLVLQLKVALVVLKKTVNDHNRALKERSDHREALAIAKKAKLIANIKEKLVRDFQRATGDASKTLADLS